MFAKVWSSLFPSMYFVQVYDLNIIFENYDDVYMVYSYIVVK